MKGVILFADDHIFDSERIENKLFNKFNKDGSFSILPINNLNILEKTVSSISTYKALILDWNFQRESDEEDVQLPDENPYEFLKSNKIYSLIYIYSQAEIAAEQKSELQKIYAGKIFFESKNPDNQPDQEYEKIMTGINQFEESNKHLFVPFVWSQAINQSAQRIFSELETASPNWIKEIYNTSKDDGGEPNSEVIGVFQNLLNESIIQNEQLINSLSTTAELPDIAVTDKESSLAKLYHRIYYTQLLKDAPLMTGDIFRFGDNEFAILITPECDVNFKKENTMEFLKFSRNEFNDFLEKKKGYKKDQFGQTKEKKLKDLSKEFNNGIMSYHILPSFPFDSDAFNSSAFISFETAFVVKLKSEFDGKRAEFKLNSPYIFQLRQRYLSYIGRVGVPTIPQSLRLYNLK